MTTKEKIEALDNLIGMVDDNHGTDYDEALKSAKRSLEAWDGVINDLLNLEWYGDEAFWDGVNAVTKIIEKYLGEVKA